MQNNPFLDAGENLSARQSAAGLDSQDFRLAAVYSVNQENTEVRLLLDGTDSPTQKYYKALTGAWPLAPDDRVIVLKMSGTYVVVGKIGGKPDDPEPPTYIAAPNTVFAGPATGTESAEATFRALTKDDIPGGGGGEVETVITENIVTPVTYITAASLIAVCGKYGHLQLSALYTKNLSKVANSSNLYQIGTISSDFIPATKITIAATYMEYENFRSGNEYIYTIGSCGFSIDTDGKVYVDNVPGYTSTDPSLRYRRVYDVEFLLP